MTAKGVMDDRLALLAAVRADPDDDALRLAFADWLDENGQAARAEYVRLQVAAAALAEPADRQLADQVREEEIAAADLPGWGDVPRYARRWVRWHRGMPSRLDVPARQFLRYGRKLRRDLPIDGVWLRKPHGAVAALAASGLLAGLRYLRVERDGTTDDDYRPLADCPDLASLRELHLSPNPIGEAAAGAVMRSRHLAGLTRLSVFDAGWPLVRAVFTSPVLTHLAALDVALTYLSEDEAGRIADAAFADSLASLNLDSCRVGEGGAAAVARLPNLRRLRASHGWLTDAAVARLAASPRLAGLEHLEIPHNNDITPAAVGHLTRATFAGTLRTLDVVWNRGTRADFERLVTARSLARLERLPWPGRWDRPADERVGAESLRVFAASGKAARFRSLDLSVQPLGPEGAAVLAATPLPALEELNLFRCDLGNDGARVLAESPHFAALVSLKLGWNDVRPTGFRALAASPHFPALRRLNLAFNRVGNLAARECPASPLLNRLHRLHLGNNIVWADTKKKLKAHFGRRIEF